MSIFTCSDLRKLYTHLCMDPDGTPETLQNKVQWDIRFYFARRAYENIDKFNKGTFQLKRHADSGLQYIIKTYDEQNKNHQMDQSDIQTACMVEVPDSKYCPVKSFLKYKSHLSPLITDLWPYPKEKNWQMSEVWYANKKTGANPLASFMSRILELADLSRVYTNHSIWVTGTTYLTHKQFIAKQIMSVIGHKSLNILAIYQKVSTDEKLSMAYAMSCYFQNDKSQPLATLPNTIQNAITTESELMQIPTKHAMLPINQPQSHKNTKINDNQLVQYESEDPFGDQNDIPDSDLGQIMETIEKENTFSMTQSAGGMASTSIMQQRQLVQKRSPQIPMFNTCRIGNINITINKNWSSVYVIHHRNYLRCY